MAQTTSITPLSLMSPTASDAHTLAGMSAKTPVESRYPVLSWLKAYTLPVLSCGKRTSRSPFPSRSATVTLATTDPPPPGAAKMAAPMYGDPSWLNAYTRPEEFPKMTSRSPSPSRSARVGVERICAVDV